MPFSMIPTGCRRCGRDAGMCNVDEAAVVRAAFRKNQARTGLSAGGPDSCRGTARRGAAWPRGGDGDEVQSAE